MALGNIFKKKKLKEKEVEEKREEVKKVETKPAVKTPRIEKEVRPGEAYQILKSPHITEKATDLTEKNQYVFKVFPKANKTEIKKAIENIFGIDVLGVKIIKVPAKKRRLGKIEGWRKGYTKAIVRIKEGQKIEVLPR